MSHLKKLIAMKSRTKAQREEFYLGKMAKFSVTNR